jgi:hypothetical protein
MQGGEFKRGRNKKNSEFFTRLLEKLQYLIPSFLFQAPFLRCEGGRNILRRNGFPCLHPRRVRGFKRPCGVISIGI